MIYVYIHTSVILNIRVFLCMVTYCYLVLRVLIYTAINVIIHTECGNKLQLLLCK